MTSALHICDSINRVPRERLRDEHSEMRAHR
jgi:hypothetical protein